MVEGKKYAKNMGNMMIQQTRKGGWSTVRLKVTGCSQGAGSFRVRVDETRTSVLQRLFVG